MFEKKPQQYGVVMLSKDQDISYKISQIFNDNNGQVDLRVMCQELLLRFNFLPMRFVSADKEKKISNYRELGLSLYPIIDNIIYEK